MPAAYPAATLFATVVNEYDAFCETFLFVGDGDIDEDNVFVELWASLPILEFI